MVAKFVLVRKDGKLEIEIEGEPGEELTPDQAIAYSQMYAAHNLSEISERLDDIGMRLSELTESLADR